MLDCGIHPGYEGTEGLPDFKLIDPESVDLLLVTHFHLDHAASLPYFTERTDFKGRVFMTHATKAVLHLMLRDYLRLMSMRARNNEGEESDQLFSEEDLINCMKKIELIDYHSVVQHKNVRFWAYNAGHVLGAAMFMLEIGGRHILYTGDYSMEDDRHLAKAEIPKIKPDLLICESTYGIQVHQTREEREAIFTGTVGRIVSEGGRCLIPVFALGRAQELLLILDEYWQANPALHTIPIWYASKLATKALRVYQTYVNFMNVRIRQAMDLGNPFQFRFIKNLKSIDVDSFDDRGPSVVFASPGMLQNGVSRKLFDRWAPDPKNGVIIAGYAVENTMAKDLANEPEDVLTLEGKSQPRNCSVVVVSFSAHVDYLQNRDFMLAVDPGHIIFVHGQHNEMRRLRDAMKIEFKDRAKRNKVEAPRLYMPDNGRKVMMRFTSRKEAVVMGNLASGGTSSISEGDNLKGVMFTQNFATRICALEDLGTYTQLRVGSVKSKLHVPFVGSLDTLRLFLLEMFSSVTESPLDGGGSAFGLHNDELSITWGGPSSRKVAVEWDASPVNDMLADAAVALVMHAQTSSATIRVTSKPCDGRHGGDGEGEGEGKGAKRKKSEDLVSCVVTVEFEEGGRGAAIRAECEDEVQGKLVQNCVAQMLGALGGIYV
ncbi:hypothetical protein TrRE_jg6884 [Triparma retinervis]|uniref:Uncharacterized protein n=1 Tax=Triparma retinervis TaxID=2557542 RepID=A0A9W7DTV6_9STRA|nr:hypothetical protein TrRE_jg6884 [Triparma retinervis]